MAPIVAQAAREQVEATVQLSPPGAEPVQHTFLLEQSQIEPALAVAQEYLNQGGYCWNSGQFAWKAATILEEIDTCLPGSSESLAQIGAAWNSPEREQVLAEVYPQMPKGSIDYEVMQKTSRACSILLPCSWEDMGTHTALAQRVGKKEGQNLVMGKAVTPGAGNIVLANTDQTVVVARDDLTVVVTDDAVFVGDKDTDMKELMEIIAKQSPEIV